MRAARRGDYFWGELFLNDNNALYAAVTNIGILNPGGPDILGRVLGSSQKDLKKGSSDFASLLKNRFARRVFKDASIFAFCPHFLFC
jgi:hypothetical protein